MQDYPMLTINPMHNPKIKFHKAWRWVIFLILLFILLGFVCNIVIIRKTASFLTNNIQTIQKNKIGLVLGTSKYRNGNQLNHYFIYRIKAAVELYQAGKIEYIIVSGDNRHSDYNEPGQMRKELIRSGVPSDRIFMDFAGFRTFDSVIRCHEVFGQNSFTIISQEFHNQRAVFIGRHMNLNVIGFNAQDVDFAESIKTSIREYFARIKVFIDIYSGHKPRFLGKKISIGQDNSNG